MKLAILPPKQLMTIKKYLRMFTSHNRLIFFVLTVSVLIYAIFSLNIMLSLPSDETYRADQSRSNKLTTQFDKETIDLINSLNTGQKTDSAGFPSGRISPFSE